MSRLLIGFVGAMRSGKDTAADRLVATVGGTIVKLAAPLYECQRAIHDVLGLAADDPLRERDRLLLQVLGTQYGRVQFGPDIWVETLLKRIAGIEGNVFCSDVRFLNEARRMQAAGFTLVGLRRSDKARQAAGATHETHASEMEIPAILETLCDVVIPNNGKLAQFHKSVDQLPAIVGGV